MTYGTTLEHAQRLAHRADVAWICGDLPQPEGREIVRHEVRSHAWLDGGTGGAASWGVWPVWRYADRPDLPDFGGPFIPIADLEAIDD